MNVPDICTKGIPQDFLDILYGSTLASFSFIFFFVLLTIFTFDFELRFSVFKACRVTTTPPPQQPNLFSFQFLFYYIFLFVQKKQSTFKKVTNVIERCHLRLKTLNYYFAIVVVAVKSCKTTKRLFISQAANVAKDNICKVTKKQNN